MGISFTTVASECDVRQIHELQGANHRSVVDAETAVNQGFTSVRHDFNVLLAMNRECPSIIAKNGEDICGYCLMMPRQFRSQVPELGSMFETLEQLHWRGGRLADNPRWFVMGQVCVAADFRGRRVFDGMYQKLREVYSRDFDLTVTEISHRNVRSLRAHRRVGFKTLLEHDDPSIDERWEIVIWDWRA